MIPLDISSFWILISKLIAPLDHSKKVYRRSRKMIRWELAISTVTVQLS